jgi:hypothetical protein
VLIVLSPISQNLTFIGPSWRVTRNLNDPNAPPSSIAVSPDGKYAIVTMEGYQNNELIIYGGVSSSPCQLWPSPDGKYLYKINADGTKVTVLGDAQTTDPKPVKPAIKVTGTDQLLAIAPLLVGIYSDFTAVKGKHPYQRAEQAVADEHWPLIGNIAGTSAKAHCKAPYTHSSGSDKAVASVLNGYQRDHGVTVPWLSFWTVDAPPPGSSPKAVGEKAGEAAAREIDAAGAGSAGQSAGLPYVILDPEGQACGNGTKGEAIGKVWDNLPAATWQQFVAGWDEGVQSADPNVTPGVYLTKYQYAKKGGSDYPHVFVAASSGSSRVPSSPRSPAPTSSAISPTTPPAAPPAPTSRTSSRGARRTTPSSSRSRRSAPPNTRNALRGPLPPQAVAAVGAP